MRYAIGLLLFVGCAHGTPGGEGTVGLRAQDEDALVAGTWRAIAYSGFREGQHPDRGHGAVLPSRSEVEEDLGILSREGFGLIRLYDSGENSKMVLEVIRAQELPMKVVLGAWLEAELSAHETCAWLDSPIPDEVLAKHVVSNQRELQRAIGLANDFSEIVVAVNVGNEALVTWNDHLVSIDSMVGYLELVADAIEQPVTTADNYLAYVEHAEALSRVVDFAFVHAYPVWEGKSIDEALEFTLSNLAMVQKALPNTPLAIGEAGWTSQAEEFGERSTPGIQTRYVAELYGLAREKNISTFVFEAFDEPWKGNPSRPLGAEKHWGLWYVDRTPKPVAQEKPWK
ncbi:MAG: glycosyl hydrolase family 17 protein [Myxococcota bacterium]